ncbi:MAG: hypothetical protein HC941_29815 [Microcoleus sp. SU_5_3]|nr:hypothetical protein [Microcoleus sp. SU_5_3]
MNTQSTVFSKSTHKVSSISLEVLLTDFVQKALADSYSQDIDANLRLLDLAWDVQKFLWKLRDDSLQNNQQ